MPITELPPSPPLSAAREVEVEDAKFEERCWSSISVKIRDKYLFGDPLVTRSNKWGVVFRADFSVRSETEISPKNRVICWTDKAGVTWVKLVYEQTLPPLR
jgi:hypothetical protein